VHERSSRTQSQVSPSSSDSEVQCIMWGVLRPQAQAPTPTAFLFKAVRPPVCDRGDPRGILGGPFPFLKGAFQTAAQG
jgi:hypothetical protein